jgi:hypothetical protein
VGACAEAIAPNTTVNDNTRIALPIFFIFFAPRFSK